MTCARPSTAGLTLLEMLVVLALLAFLLAVTFPTLQSWRQAEDVRSAQAIIQTELSRARLTAKRTSTPQAVTWTPTTFRGAGLGRAQISTPPQTITYHGPHGTVEDPSPLTLTITSGQRTGSVVVVGVFGKAYSQPVN